MRASCVALASLLAACAGPGVEQAATQDRTDRSSTSSAGSEAVASDTAPDPAAPDGSSSTSATEAADDGEAPASAPTTGGSGLPGATVAQHSAPPDGAGVALLRDVRVGRHDGFERIVFEFAGEGLPGYRMEWTEADITADGSGAPVRVDGAARLVMVFDPASGVDLSGAEFAVVYQGPDRIPLAGATEVVRDLVRTGDFEGILTWVAGASSAVPFRVQVLRSPARLVVDVEA